MPRHDLMDPTDLIETPRPRCHAKAKSTGRSCRNAAIPGGRVCRIHGGSAPQVQRAARLRLAELVDPAIAALAKIVEDDPAAWVELSPGVWKPVGVAHEVKVRAAEAILDRAGYPRRTDVNVTDARDRIRERLAARRAEQEGEA